MPNVETMKIAKILRASEMHSGIPCLERNNSCSTKQCRLKLSKMPPQWSDTGMNYKCTPFAKLHTVILSEFLCQWWYYFQGKKKKIENKIKSKSEGKRSKQRQNRSEHLIGLDLKGRGEKNAECSALSICLLWVTFSSTNSRSSPAKVGPTTKRTSTTTNPIRLLYKITG